MAETVFIKKKDFEELLKKLIKSGKRIYAPVRIEEKLHLRCLNELGDVEKIVYNGIRSVQTLKSLVFPSREIVATFPQSFSLPRQEEIIVLGAKACDLQSLKVLDKALSEGDFSDPFYKTRRANLTIVGSDCPAPGENCFCSLVGLNPYAQEFDLNWTLVKDGLVFEIGSEKGRALIEEWKKQGAAWTTAPASALSEREEKRKKAEELLKEINKEFMVSSAYEEIVGKAIDPAAWEKILEKCVQCQSCINGCPTCFCFLLCDQGQKEPSSFVRTRVWDACLHPGFARVAAGANSRPDLGTRMNHRYGHKFVYIPQEYKICGCVGCGRCIEGCLGKLDIREVLKELSKESSKQKQGAEVK